MAGDYISEILAQTIAEATGDTPEPFAIDGDTFTVPGSRQNVRLAGADTPETSKPWSPAGQPGSDLATEIANRILQEPGARLDVSDEADATGSRRMGTLTRGDGTDAAAFLIQQGLATPTKWSSQQQIDAEQAGLVTRSQFPHWQTDEENAIQEERAGEPGWQFDPTVVGAEGRSAQGAGQAALTRGADQFGNMLSGFGQLGAQLIGDEEAEKSFRADREAGDLAIAANPPRVESIIDSISAGHFGDIPTWAIEKLGENAPQLIATLTGAGAGTWAGRKLGMAAADALTGAGGLTAQGAKTVAAMPQALGTTGRVLGMAATAAPMNIGETQNELDEAGIRAPGTALVGGTLKSLLDSVGGEAMLGRFFGPAKQILAKNLVEGVAKGFGKAFGVGVIGEMPTEAAQELIDITARAYHDPSYQIFTPENFKRVAEAGLAGGVVGGVVGGASGAIQGVGYQKHLKLDGGAETGAPAPNTPPGLPQRIKDNERRLDDMQLIGGLAADAPEVVALQQETEELRRQAAALSPAPSRVSETVTPDQATGVMQQQDMPLGEPKQWYELLPDKGMPLEFQDDKPDGGKVTTTHEAKARAVEMKDTMDAYRLLRQCLSR